MWSELGKVASWDRRKADAVLCRPCLRLKCDLERQVKRTEAEKKIKRQISSSHARTSYMSPVSQAKRKYNQKMDRSAKKYTPIPVERPHKSIRHRRALLHMFEDLRE